MRRINLIFILFAILVVGCKKHKCVDYSCFSPPRYFQFDLVDKTTGENVFTNGTYTESDIEIINLLDSTIYDDFSFNEYATNWIEIRSIGWQSEIVNLSINILGNHIFNFYVDAIRKNEHCCSFTEYNEIKIDSANYEFNANTDSYTVYIE